jgi:hypothetical protein
LSWCQWGAPLSGTWTWLEMFCNTEPVCITWRWQEWNIF